MKFVIIIIAYKGISLHNLNDRNIAVHGRLESNSGRTYYEGNRYQSGNIMMICGKKPCQQ